MQSQLELKIKLRFFLNIPLSILLYRSVDLSAELIKINGR
jgi:hypothetical protein